MKKKFKIYNKYEHHILSDCYLTELMITKSGFKPKKGLGGNFAIFSLLTNYLSDFGINIYGETELRGSITNELLNIWVLHIFLDKNIPEENLDIIHNLYGWTNVVVNISLIYNEDYSVNVDYNTETKTCVLKKTVFGTDHCTILLPSLWEAIKQSKNIAKK